MPDWVTHIGAGYLISRGINREDISLAVIGSILPDLISRIEVILLDFLHVRIFESFSFSCFHTPFMLAFLSLAFALCCVRPGRSFVILFGFSLLHLFLDMLTVHIPGFGIILFFPLSYKAYSWNLFKLEGVGYLAVYGFFLLILLRSVFRQHAFPKINWTKKLIGWVLPLLFFMALFPFYANHLMLINNVGGGQFLRKPEMWEGKKVGIHVSRVISSNPTTVEENGRRFEVATNRAIEEGKWVSLYGTYREGKIFPDIIIQEMGSFIKSILSVAGLLYLILFFIL